MATTAADQGPPPGFEVVVKDTPLPTVKVKAAEPAKVEEAIAETAAPETPATPAEEQAAAEPSAFDKAKIAADKAKKGAAANRKLRDQGVQLQQQLREQAQTTAQLEAKLRQATSYLEQAVNDPIGLLKSRGVPETELAKRVALAGSPEGQIEAMRAEIEETKRQLQAQHEQARAREEATRQAQVENAYLTTAKDEAKYPNIAHLDGDVILTVTEKVIRDLRSKAVANGHVPANDEAAMARYMRQYEDHHFLEYLNSKFAKKAASQEPASAPAAPETGSTKTKTITNKLASAKHVAPVDFSKMNDRQQRKEMARQLREAGLGR